MSEHDTLQRLLAFLRARGFPDDALLTPAMAEATLRPDLVVIEPRTNAHLAVIEVKRRLGIGGPAAMAQLQAYADNLGLDRSVPLFVASETDTEPSQLQIHRLIEHRLEPIAESAFPTFRALAAEVAAGTKAAVTTKTRKTADSFATTSRVLALSGLALFTTDALIDRYAGWQLLTPTRLTVLGAVVLLLVLPYAAKLKALGIEWERHKLERSGE